MRRALLTAAALLALFAAPASARMVYERSQGGGERRGIYVARDDGSHARLVAWRGYSPYLSPSGRFIAYFGKDRRGLHVVGTRGLHDTIVLRHAYEAVPAAPLAWSPDERWIVAARDSGENEGPWLVDRRRHTARELGGHDAYGGASFDPRGSRFAAGSADDKPGYRFATYALDPLRRLSRGFGSSPVWGRRGLAFTQFPPIGDGVPSGTERIALRAGGRTRTLLEERASLYPVDWSDDGRVLLVSEQTEPEKPVRAVLLRAGSGKVTRIPTLLGEVYDLSRDGRRVLGAIGPGVVSVTPGGKVRLLADRATHARWTK
jgi:hypothetical protein